MSELASETRSAALDTAQAFTSSPFVSAIEPIT
ncbi:hypothetical protein BH18ACT1_BH18ACT1_14780 [soil metagenome]